MVDDDLERSAEELRETAQKLRLLAGQTRSAAARDGLVDLAERFERMAGRLAGDDPPPNP